VKRKRYCVSVTLDTYYKLRRQQEMERNRGRELGMGALVARHVEDAEAAAAAVEAARAARDASFGSLRSGWQDEPAETARVCSSGAPCSAPDCPSNLVAEESYPELEEDAPLPPSRAYFDEAAAAEGEP